MVKGCSHEYSLKCSEVGGRPGACALPAAGLAVPNAESARGVHAGEALARARGPDRHSSRLKLRRVGLRALASAHKPYMRVTGGRLLEGPSHSIAGCKITVSVERIKNCLAEDSLYLSFVHVVPHARHCLTRTTLSGIGNFHCEVVLDLSLALSRSRLGVWDGIGDSESPLTRPQNSLNRWRSNGNLGISFDK
jgi:hypothetical protein